MHSEDQERGEMQSQSTEGRDLNAHHEIQRHISLYSNLLDERRLDEWGELFVSDAVFSFPGGTFRGRKAIIEGMDKVAVKRPRRVMHLVAPSIIEVNAEHAWAWTDLLSVQIEASGQVEQFMAGRYHDALVKMVSGWRFSRRAVIIHGAPDPEDLRSFPVIGLQGAGTADSGPAHGDRSGGDHMKAIDIVRDRLSRHESGDI